MGINLSFPWELGGTAAIDTIFASGVRSTHARLRLSKNKNPLSQNKGPSVMCRFSSSRISSSKRRGMVRYGHEIQGIRPQVGFQLVRLYWLHWKLALPCVLRCLSMKSEVQAQIQCGSTQNMAARVLFFFYLAAAALFPALHLL
jgi:hypothetical protein